jgi:hypothetical protein
MSDALSRGAKSRDEGHGANVVTAGAAGDLSLGGLRGRTAPLPPASGVTQGAAHPLVVAGARDRIRRHGFSARFVHWSVAVSTVLLMFSGFGQMPMYARYKVDQLPLLGWSSDFDIAIVMHYLAALLLILAVTYHIAVHLLRREFGILPRRGDLK